MLTLSQIPTSEVNVTSSPPHSTSPLYQGDEILPPDAAQYANRSLHIPSTIYPGTPAYAAFDSRNWDWGGSWFTRQGTSSHTHTHTLQRHTHTHTHTHITHTSTHTTKTLTHITMTHTHTHTYTHHKDARILSYTLVSHRLSALPKGSPLLSNHASLRIKKNYSCQSLYIAIQKGKTID